MLQHLLGFLAVCVISLGLTSCGLTENPRVVLVPPITMVDGAPTNLIKIGPGVTGRIYIKVGDKWVLSDNAVVIPEGWFAAPLDVDDQ